MGVTVRETQVALNTSTGTQDITISGLGAASEIKAAMFICTSATGGIAIEDHANLSVGFTDGTTHRVVSNNSDDDVGTVDANSRSATDEVIMIINNAGGIDIEATFDSFITDGVRINIGNDGAAVDCSVILWAGTGISAEVGEFTLDSSVSSTVSPTVGFEFEHMIAIMPHPTNAFADTATDDWGIGFGMCNNDGGGAFTQGALAYHETTGDASGNPLAGHFTDRVCASVLDASGSAGIETTGEVTAASSSSFTVTTRDAGVSGADVAFLILSYGGGQHWVDGDQLAPTSNGVFSVTDVGFKPQFVMVGIGNIEPGNSLTSGGTQSGIFAVGAFGASEGHSPGFKIRQDTGTTETGSYSISNRSIFLGSQSGGVTRFRADTPVMLSNGYSLDYDILGSGSPAKHWVVLAVGQVLTEQEGYRWRDDDDDENSAAWLAAQEVDITRAKSTNTRLRTVIDTVTEDPPTAQVAIQYRKVGDADTEWRDVPL